MSHALKDKADISENTKRIIRDAAQELGYVGNASASFLRTGRSQTIAVILGDISNPHFSILIKEIESFAGRFGYTVLILNTDEEEKKEKDAILSVLKQNVDGIILCPSQHSTKNIVYLQSLGIPFVLIGRRFSDMDTNYVVCDDVNGGYLAAKHLLELGHRNILFLTGGKHISSSTERLAGYKKALDEFDIPVDPVLIHSVSVRTADNQRELRHIVESGLDFSAVIAFSDMIAWEVIYFLQQAGRAVPADCSIIGFDNIQSKFLFPMELTSISTAKSTMAAEAASILLNCIQNKKNVSGNTFQLILPTRLVVRKTTQRMISRD